MEDEMLNQIKEETNSRMPYTAKTHRGTLAQI